MVQAGHLQSVVLGVPGPGEHEDVEDDDECVQDTQLNYQPLYRHLQSELRLRYDQESHQVTLEISF